MFRGAWKLLWRDDNVEIPISHSELKESSKQVRHAAGMIIQIFENTQILHKNVYLEFPEDLMHPKQQQLLMTMVHFLVPQLRMRASSDSLTKRMDDWTTRYIAKELGVEEEYLKAVEENEQRDGGGES